MEQTLKNINPIIYINNNNNKNKPKNYYFLYIKAPNFIL